MWLPVCWEINKNDFLFCENCTAAEHERDILNKWLLVVICSVVWFELIGWIHMGCVCFFNAVGRHEERAPFPDSRWSAWTHPESDDTQHTVGFRARLGQFLFLYSVTSGLGWQFIQKCYYCRNILFWFYQNSCQRKSKLLVLFIPAIFQLSRLNSVIHVLLCKSENVYLKETVCRKVSVAFSFHFDSIWCLIKKCISAALICCMG